MRIASSNTHSHSQGFGTNVSVILSASVWCQASTASTVYCPRLQSTACKMCDTCRDNLSKEAQEAYPDVSSSYQALKAAPAQTEQKSSDSKP